MGNRGPSSTSNTTNSTHTATTVGDIGLTGAQAQNVLIAFARNLRLGFESLGGNYAGFNSVYGNTLAGLTNAAAQGNAQNLAAGRAIITSGYQFSNQVIDRSATLFERTALNSTSTLNGLINATRDFSQRVIAGSTGQATPLQNLSEASQYAGTAPGSESSTLLILGTLIALVALFKD